MLNSHPSALDIRSVHKAAVDILYVIPQVIRDNIFYTLSYE